MDDSDDLIPLMLLEERTQAESPRASMLDDQNTPVLQQEPIAPRLRRLRIFGIAQILLAFLLLAMQVAEMSIDSRVGEMDAWVYSKGCALWGMLVYGLSGSSVVVLALRPAGGYIVAVLVLTAFSITTALTTMIVIFVNIFDIFSNQWQELPSHDTITFHVDLAVVGAPLLVLIPLAVVCAFSVAHVIHIQGKLCEQNVPASFA